MNGQEANESMLDSWEQTQRVENKVSDGYRCTDSHRSSTHAIQSGKHPHRYQCTSWMNAPCFIHTMECYSATKSDATTRMNTHQEKEATGRVSYDSRTGRSTATESKLVAAAEGRKGVWG